MRKIAILALLALALAASGCVTDVKASDPMKNNAPDWIKQSQGELEYRPEYKGNFVFKDTVQGKSLLGVQTMAEEYNVGGQISKLVATRIKTKFSGAIVGSVDGAETYFEKVVNSVSDASISGWRKQDSYWLQREVKEGGKTKLVYEAYVLMTVPVAEVKKAVARAFDENPAKDENEKRARDKVKETMDKEEEW